VLDLGGSRIETDRLKMRSHCSVDNLTLQRQTHSGSLTAGWRARSGCDPIPTPTNDQVSCCHPL